MIGCVFNVLTFLFVGPSPIFHLDKLVPPGMSMGFTTLDKHLFRDLWVVALSLAVMGLGIGAQLIPPFQNCLEEAKYSYLLLDCS